MVYMMARRSELRGEIPLVNVERGKRFAQILRTERAKRGWTQTDLHLATGGKGDGVSKTYISVLDNDGINNATGEYQRPSEAIIDKLANALGATPESRLILRKAMRIAAGWQAEDLPTPVPSDDLRDLLLAAADRIGTQTKITRVIDPDMQDMFDDYEGIADGPLKEDAKNALQETKDYIRRLNELSATRFRARNDIIGKRSDFGEDGDGDGLERISVDEE